MRSGNERRKKIKFFSAATFVARCAKLAAPDVIFPKNRPPEHSIPPRSNFSENSRHENKKNLFFLFYKNIFIKIFLL